MTELAEIEKFTVTTNAEAIALIDKGLSTLAERQLVSAAEVADILLDLRSLLDS